MRAAVLSSRTACLQAAKAALQPHVASKKITAEQLKAMSKTIVASVAYPTDTDVVGTEVEKLLKGSAAPGDAEHNRATAGASQAGESSTTKKEGRPAKKFNLSSLKSFVKQRVGEKRARDVPAPRNDRSVVVIRAKSGDIGGDFRSTAGKLCDQLKECGSTTLVGELERISVVSLREAALRAGLFLEEVEDASADSAAQLLNRASRLAEEQASKKLGESGSTGADGGDKDEEDQDDNEEEDVDKLLADLKGRRGEDGSSSTKIQQQQASSSAQSAAATAEGAAEEDLYADLMDAPVSMPMHMHPGYAPPPQPHHHHQQGQYFQPPPHF